MINKKLKHTHDEKCGCGHDHNHNHKHDHKHDENCGCEHNHEKNLGIGYYLSPIGFIEVKTNFNFVTNIGFVKNEETAVETQAVLDAIKQLDEYFRGIRKTLNLKLALQGTPFQRKVYISLLNIPYGKTMSYRDIAAMLGDPKLARAVGNANNRNSILIAIPCHRVTRKNGKLSGTKEWQQKQQWLIDHEKEK